ncbi:MAG: hypothetical protein J6U94_02725 [Paludibacteraceae bacterium]|nr:hypothetical protein [Paludibacteraceae bacterium]
MAQIVKACILQLDENGEITGRYLWDENCQILEVLQGADSLRVQSSFCSMPEVVVRIPDNMDWGVFNGMRFNYRTWINDDHMILLNY